LIEKGISHLHFYGDFLKKIKKVKYKTNGVSLQYTVSLIAQDFLNRKYNKHILKNTCSFVLSSETMANMRVTPPLAYCVLPYFDPAYCVLPYFDIAYCVPFNKGK